MHVAIFPTWSCQLICDYCSIRHSQIDRSVSPVPWQKWAKALPKVLPRNSIIDIAGGEPLLYDGIVDLLIALGANHLRWALTTNAKATAQIERLCEDMPPGAVCINVSDHIGNPEAHGNIAALRDAGYAVNVHRVDHPAAGTHESDAELITYQDWVDDNAVDGIARKCTAGAEHWVADPQGDLWRCIVAMQIGQPSSGNLFTREVHTTGLRCEFGCTSCYTEDPESWGIEMRETACTA